MSPHISTQSDKINEGYCAIGGVHIRYFSAESDVEKSGQLAALNRAKQVSRLHVAEGLSRVLGARL